MYTALCVPINESRWGSPPPKLFEKKICVETLGKLGNFWPVAGSSLRLREGEGGRPREREAKS